jgi:hypothetical protein
VDLLDQAGCGQHTEITADRHVGDAEIFDQVGNPNRTIPPDEFEDVNLALLGQHVSAPPLQ